jgi:predicted acetyltransferase
MTPAHVLHHADGFAVYRLEEDWNVGHARHTLHLVELAAITPEAHLALWHTLLGMDLVAEIRSRALSLHEPLPFLLENQRAFRTIELNDGVWVNVRDVAIAFGNRTYRTTDRIVIEADGVRYAIDGSPEGATCKAVRTRPDLVTSTAMLGSLLYGGATATELVAGRRMTARNADAVRRADLFFTSVPPPHCQSPY